MEIIHTKTTGLLSGVRRRSKEDKEFANFDIFDDPNRPYSTFNFKYSNLAFDRLSTLTEFNTLLCKDMILQKIKDCVKRVQKYKFTKRVPIKLKDIKKLKIKNKTRENQLREFVESFDHGDGDFPISTQLQTAGQSDSHTNLSENGLSESDLESLKIWEPLKNYPSNRHSWRAVWSGSTMFANPSASFGRWGIVIWWNHTVQILGWLQKMFGVSKKIEPAIEITVLIT